MRIAPLDPAALTAGQASAWHELVSSAHDADFPGEPALVRTQTMGEFVGSEDERHVWGAWSDDELVGAIILMTWGRENPNYAEAQGWVRPDHRRQGVGRGLVRRAVDETVNRGRREITVFDREKAPASVLLKSEGFTDALKEVRSILYLEDVDRPRVYRWADGEAARTEGYELVRWIDRCPDEYLEAYARAVGGMNDAPMGDLGWNPVTTDGERIRRREDASRRRGNIRHVLAVRERATGALAGVTVMFVHAGSPRASQGDTTVLAPYRGRGFGLWLKAEMIRWLTQIEPDITQHETWNAAENTYMRAVNTKLGYRPVDTWIAWNRKIGPQADESPAS